MIDNRHKDQLISLQVLISYRGDATRSADLKILAERLADGTISEKEIVLAADAAPSTHEGWTEADEPLARAGWREVLARSDRLAEQCVRIVREWDGGTLWPYAHTITIPQTTTGAEFIARLQPAPQRALAQCA